MQRGSIVFWETVSVPQVFPAFSQTTVKASNERQKDFFQGGGPLRDFSKIFPGGAEVVKFVFSHRKLRKQHFLLKFSKSKGGRDPPADAQSPTGYPGWWKCCLVKAIFAHFTHEILVETTQGMSTRFSSLLKPVNLDVTYNNPVFGWKGYAAIVKVVPMPVDVVLRIRRVMSPSKTTEVVRHSN